MKVAGIISGRREAEEIEDICKTSLTGERFRLLSEQDREDGISKAIKKAQGKKK